MIVLKRILVPTDFSETSAAAVTYGVAFARAFGARLFLAHVAVHNEFEAIVESQRVVEDALGGLVAAASPIAPDMTLQHAAHDLLARTLSAHDQQGLDVEYVLLDGGLVAPHAEILRYATEQEIDLIIMGTHGRGRVAHILMGGVAEHVVRKAPCPVLTVRHPEHEFVMPDVDVISGILPS
jgi:nucleotide-binding universal stress UspA family protein